MLTTTVGFGRRQADHSCQMDAGDGFERFQVTDWDLENEFNTQRFKKGMSKKRALYGKSNVSSRLRCLDFDHIFPGLFASDSESDDEGNTHQVKKDIAFVKSTKVDPEQQAPDVTKPSTSRMSSGTSSRSNRFAGVPVDHKLGDWEKHTKGIGSKLLAKMGWQPGQGIGKNQQGIVAPIEASLRPAKVGIGAAGKEKKQKAVFAKDLDQPRHSTSETGASNREPTVQKRYIYKSVDELMEGDDEDVICLNTKVIDMRGPESKVVTGYKEMFTTTKTMPSGPEAEIEASIMAVEKDLVKVTRDIKRNRDRLERIEDDKVFIDTETRKESEELDRLVEIGQLVKKLKSSNRGDPSSSLSNALETYKRFLKEFPSDVNRLKIRVLMQTLLAPLVDQCLRDWDPFDRNQESFIEVISLLKKTLSSQDSRLYQTLLWKSWIPRFRRCFQNFQNMKVPDNLISSLEAWKSVLPKWLFSNIINSIVVPRIEHEIENWDPLTDVVPVHTWIHPWLVLIDGKLLESVYRTILQKFGKAISSWDPSDASAKIILSPWRTTISTPSWNSFMSTHITPKLERSIQSLTINPGDQRLEQWTWLMDWQEMIPDAVIAGILTKHFFPNWIRILHEWLSSPACDFGEVSNWYVGWKSLIPEGILSDPLIQDYLQRALEMMDFAVSSPFGMSAYTYQPTMPTQFDSGMRSQLLAAAALSANESMTFKELVARKAQERGLLFMPIASKTLDGKQIYSLGQHHVYLDRSVVFALNSQLHQWIPVPLESLF